ncbi:hypothetical protein [[Kitasatospora] papulosa]|uniref:hypothetical protein n=1 Tax=[Kitasatospora] papulosa TaxID=1464011 RepID=UPI00371B683B
MTSKIPARGGRKGQQHRATPDDLRLYTVSPASRVTVTRADGSTDTRAAKAARKATSAPRRRGPAVCAMCGDPIDGKVWVSREQGSRGKPVHPACEQKALAFTAERRAAKQQTQAATPKRVSLVEENRRLFAQQDRIREMRRTQQGQPKTN